MDPDRLHHSMESSQPGTDCQESESSTTAASTVDSGYGSTDTGGDTAANVHATRSFDNASIPQGSRPSVSPFPLRDSAENASPPNPPSPAQRRFRGLPIFNPTELQVQRYNDILQHISPALEGALKKRPKLIAVTSRHKLKRIDAVRLVVAGGSQDTARPYIVFLCNLDVGRTIRSLLNRTTYQDLLKVHGRDDLSFLYEIIQDSVQVMFGNYRYSVDTPCKYWDQWKPTYCGIPVRLHRGDGDETRGRSTLGGIICVSQPGFVKYYAMTAGHFFDGWDEAAEPQSEDDVESGSEEDISKDGEADGGGIPNPKDHHNESKDPPAMPSEAESPSPWDSDDFETTPGAPTAGHCRDFEYSDESLYFDWAPWQANPWQPKSSLAVMQMGKSKSKPINDHSKTPARDPEAAKSAVIPTASAGTIHGATAAGTAKLAIEPGRQLIGTHVISPLTAG